jgi:hypothetical protein
MREQEARAARKAAAFVKLFPELIDVQREGLPCRAYLLVQCSANSLAERRLPLGCSFWDRV